MALLFVIWSLRETAIENSLIFSAQSLEPLKPHAKRPKAAFITLNRTVPLVPARPFFHILSLFHVVAVNPPI